MSALGQKQPLSKYQILAPERLVSGYTGHSPLRLSGECQRLLSARSGHQINLENDIVSGRKRSKAHIEVVAVEHCLPKTLGRLQAIVFNRHAGGARGRECITGRNGSGPIPANFRQCPRTDRAGSSELLATP
jgi:hypothetical protein